MAFALLPVPFLGACPASGVLSSFPHLLPGWDLQAGNTPISSWFLSAP